MQATLSQLADLVCGQLVGDGQVIVVGAATLHDVREGQITLVDQPERVSQLAKCKAAAAIVPVGTTVEGLPTIQVGDVHAAFGSVVSWFRPRRRRRRVGVSPLAIISPSARLGYDVDVYPGVTIGDDVEIGAGSTIHSGVHILAGCKLGERVTIYPNAVLYEDTHVGPRSVVHASVVLGADGFGYKLVEGRHQLAPQLGSVEIGADVEIGAGTTIDRGTYGPTRVGDGTKIDDQVMIAHNCQIGRHNIICSQVGIAGSSSTGDYVVIAGQAGIRDHVHIGKGSVLGGMAGIISDVPEGSRLLGIPATSEKDQWLRQAAFARLPEMRRQLKALQQAVDELQSAASAPKKSAA